MNKIHKIDIVKKVLLDPYCVATILFVFWICLFDDQNIYTQCTLYKQLQKLEADRMHYTTYIQKMKQETKAFLQDNELLEKLAREKYYMKKEKEDLYIIVHG